GALPRARPVPARAVPGAEVRAARVVPVRRWQPGLPGDALRAVRDEGPAGHTPGPGPADSPGGGAIAGAAVRDRPGAGRRGEDHRPGIHRLSFGLAGGGPSTARRARHGRLPTRPAIPSRSLRAPQTTAFDSAPQTVPGGMPTSSWAWIPAASHAHEDVGMPPNHRHLR